jgi:hypothetical protein
VPVELCDQNAMTCSRALLSALWCALQLPCAARILLEGASNFHPLIPPRPRFQPEASSYLAVLWVRGCQLSGCGRTLQSPTSLKYMLRIRLWSLAPSQKERVYGVKFVATPSSTI